MSVGRNPQSREVRVSSWNELQDRLFEASWQEPLERFRSNDAFRGVPDVAYDLRTSLIRLGGPYGDLENHLLRNFRKYARSAMPTVDSPWAWLALGQHHGLPTRMLDWTYSPFVAMHFATEDIGAIDCDAAIWCLDYVRTKELLPRSLRDILESEGSNVFTIEMLTRGAPALQALERLAPEPFVVFVEPPSFDERIVNQYALFSLMSSASAQLDVWLQRHVDTYRRIIIPAWLKPEIRDKLDQANVTERVLFPGLDGLCLWLRRHYGPPLGAQERQDLERRSAVFRNRREL